MASGHLEYMTAYWIYLSLHLWNSLSFQQSVLGQQGLTCVVPSRLHMHALICPW